MLNDDELAKIRERKMKLMLERAQKAKEPEVQEPLANGHVNELTDHTFWDRVKQTKVALIDFYGTWCQPCKQLAPIFTMLASDYRGKVFFGKIDIDRNPMVTRQFNVQSVPMIYAFKNGAPVANLPGLRRYDDYDMLAERLLAA